MKVRLVDLARLHAPIRDAIDAAIARVIDSGRFVLGEEVDALEREIAAALGVARAVGVSSGSDALFCALAAAGVGAGDEVIVPAFTFVATAEAVVRARAKPVFADVGDDGNLDVGDAMARVTPRTRAIVPVDLFGRRADVEALARSGLAVIVDAAQSIGAGISSSARAAALSFFPTKNLGALGDGGLVATNDDAIAAHVRALRAHGATARYVHAHVGWNMRLDALQAAVLRAKLPHLAAWNASRKRIAARYTAELAELDGLALPKYQPNHVWHHYVISVEEHTRGGRDALRAHLAERGIDTEIYYPLALHLQPCFAHLGGRAGDFPNAEAITRRALALPIHPVLDDAEVAHVIDAVQSFFARTEKT